MAAFSQAICWYDRCFWRPEPPLHRPTRLVRRDSKGDRAHGLRSVPAGTCLRGRRKISQAVAGLSFFGAVTYSTGAQPHRHPQSRGNGAEVRVRTGTRAEAPDGSPRRAGQRIKNILGPGCGHCQIPAIALSLYQYAL